MQRLLIPSRIGWLELDGMDMADLDLRKANPPPATLLSAKLYAPGFRRAGSR
jgi:hypothetical protein